MLVKNYYWKLRNIVKVHPTRNIFLARWESWEVAYRLVKNSYAIKRSKTIKLEVLCPLSVAARNWTLHCQLYYLRRFYISLYWILGAVGFNCYQYPCLSIYQLKACGKVDFTTLQKFNNVSITFKQHLNKIPVK